MITRDEEHHSASSIALHARRPPLRRPLFALVTLLCLALPTGAAAAKPPERHMEVVQVEGAIDPMVASLIKSSIRRAQTDGASVLILQVDSSGALDTDPLDLIDEVSGSKVPVAVWVGPGKAAARGAATALVAAASYSAASPNARLGPAEPLRLDGRPSVDLHHGGFSGLPPRVMTPLSTLAGRGVSGKAGADEHLVDTVAPTIGDVIVALNGKTVPTAAGPVRLSTAKEIQTKGGPRQTADQPVSFMKLGTLASVQHSLTSPSMVFLLLVVGLSLMVFEFFTVGIGLAGFVGAAAVAGALYGCSHLPVNHVALALLLLSTFGFAVDVQAGTQGFWTGVGVVGLLLGSLKLFSGSAALHVPLWLGVLIFVGQIVFMLGGMTVAVRNRFSVPTVGRDSMIGELGEARTELDPDGVVVVRGAPWRARTGRGHPVSKGGAVRVVAVDRLVLQVEPGDAAAGG